MTDLDRRPAEVYAALGATRRASSSRADSSDPMGRASAMEILEPREVPLGGPRAMTVRRTLPQRSRSLIGAWCFVDHYGPDDVAVSGGMRVPGHPHTGLATVTWMFEGEVEHRDTLGTRLTVRPGEVNLMTSGAGIAHSEFSTPDTTRIHGAQLWLALPEQHRNGPRRFENYAAPQKPLGEGRVRVFLGSLAGSTSPVETHTPVVGAELEIAAGGAVDLPVATGFEHGILIDTGTVRVEADGLEPQGARPAQLLYVPTGWSRITVRAGAEAARVLLIGGRPFGESIVMWWNFIGRSHDDIVADRAAWQTRVARLAAGDRAAANRTAGDRAAESETACDRAADDRAADDRAVENKTADDFGDFPPEWRHVLPAPELPTVRLRSRA